jgi:hypothetical protein
MTTTPKPKTTTARVAALRQRRASSGIKRLELYAHQDDHPMIKTFASNLTKKRKESN